MKKNLEKTLATVGILSTLFLGGCNGDFFGRTKASDNENFLNYAKKNSTELRDGYYEIENFKLEYKHINEREILEDSIYSKLLFTNNQETTRKILTSLNGFYQSKLFNEGDAVIFKDGDLYEIQFEGDALEGKLTNSKKTSFIPPAIILDYNKILTNFDYLVEFDPNGPFANKEPFIEYNPILLEKKDNDLYLDYVELRDGSRWWVGSSFNLFERLKDNSRLIVSVGSHYWDDSEKEIRVLTGNPEAYKVFSPILENKSNF